MRSIKFKAASYGLQIITKAKVVKVHKKIPPPPPRGRRGKELLTESRDEMHDLGGVQ